jgi:hypothetical protein
LIVIIDAWILIVHFIIQNDIEFAAKIIRRHVAYFHRLVSRLAFVGGGYLLYAGATDDEPDGSLLLLRQA